MDVLFIPGVQAILSVAAMSWVASFSISLLALVFVSNNGWFRFYVPELKTIVGLVSLAMLTVHVVSGRWMLF
ncbi:MAG: hypothetical protein JSS83_25900 [Cyanobacteria bacterium SZAS LIN-3]|nr:hypothetical protein [Cyanobacteria bacterium SZAS LIN-3]MBS2011194.1 hypothetical protein [Cyanobacteria bacterium SZAS TMP-1]